jgi:hypothetical protein
MQYEATSNNYEFGHANPSANIDGEHIRHSGTSTLGNWGLGSGVNKQGSWY